MLYDELIDDRKKYQKPIVPVVPVVLGSKALTAEELKHTIGDELATRGCDLCLIGLAYNKNINDHVYGRKLRPDPYVPYDCVVDAD